jgi:hypothetical protein
VIYALFGIMRCVLIFIFTVIVTLLVIFSDESLICTACLHIRTCYLSSALAITVFCYYGRVACFRMCIRQRLELGVLPG